jgi:hypothetical protein
MAFDNIIYLAYYIFTIYSFNIIKLTPENCLHINPYATVLIYSIIILAIFDIFRYLLSYILIILGFPILLYYFFKDPKDFIQKFGIDPEVIDNWPTIQANHSHVTDCVICTEEITENQMIMVLNCNGKHYYHANCIKDWLKVKVCCPICRSTNVF